MFDGHLMMTQKSKNARLVINMLAENEDYFDKVIETLEALDIGYKLTYPPIYDKDGYDRKQQIRLESRNHPIFTKIRNRIYINGRKVVDPHMLKFMDDEFLAIMFMADGSRYLDVRWENSTPQYRLHLNNLSYGDLMLIKNSLKSVFNLESNIRKKGDKYDLAIPTGFSEFFELLVEKHIVPSLQYKIGR